MMARVRGVTACATSFSSRLQVSRRASTNTGVAPRSTTALAVLTKVKDGMMTSSPGPISASRTAISSACVHEDIKWAAGQPVRDKNQSSHIPAYAPRPASRPGSSTALTAPSSVPRLVGRLNGMLYSVRSEGMSADYLLALRLLTLSGAEYNAKSDNVMHLNR